MSNRYFVDFGLLRKRVVLTGGKSGAAFRCKRWVLDARREIQDLNGSRENKAYNSICIECLSDDILRTNSDEVQKYGKLSMQRRDEARCRRWWKRLWKLNSTLLFALKLILDTCEKIPSSSCIVVVEF
jgi:hypothetical protein